MASLSLIDSFIPLQHKFQGYKHSPDDTTLVGYLVDHLEGMFGRKLHVASAQLKSMSREQQLEYVLQQATKAGILPPGFHMQQMYQFFEVYKANHMAFLRYQPQPYTGKMTLFCPKQQLFVLSRANIHAWNKLTDGNVKVCHVAGDHYTIMQGASITEIAHIVRQQIGESDQTVHTGDAV